MLDAQSCTTLSTLMIFKVKDPLWAAFDPTLTTLMILMIGWSLCEELHYFINSYLRRGSLRGITASLSTTLMIGWLMGATTRRVTRVNLRDKGGKDAQSYPSLPYY